jgi:hypothetical protein
MFVRFRERHGRLLVSLVETRRVAGKVRQEYIADFGAIDMPPSARDRQTYWPKVHERISRLSNRIPSDQVGAIIGAIHARVPMVSVDEVPAINKDGAEKNLKWWQTHQAWCDEQVELHKLMKADVERKVEMWSEQAARSRAGVERAQAAIDDPTKPPPPELTRKEMIRILRAAGMTKQDMHRARKVAAMSEEELEAHLARRFRKPKRQEA